MVLLPWWIYLCIAGILYSGYMFFRTSREEQAVDEAFIEKEGQVYMERMQEERERRSAEKMSADTY